LFPWLSVLQVEEEFEIDLNDNEPDFLRGQTQRTGVEMSPIKIVKNPDGSMQRAAMTQVGAGVQCLAFGVLRDGGQRQGQVQRGSARGGCSVLLPRVLAALPRLLGFAFPALVSYPAQTELGGGYGGVFGKRQAPFGQSAAFGGRPAVSLPCVLAYLSSTSTTQLPPSAFIQALPLHTSPPRPPQSALAKERRELREQQNRMVLEAIPKDLSKPWEDPLAGG
jgi:hypothetical protein